LKITSQNVQFKDTTITANVISNPQSAVATKQISLPIKEGILNLSNLTVNETVELVLPFLVPNTASQHNKVSKMQTQKTHCIDFIFVRIYQRNGRNLHNDNRLAYYGCTTVQTDALRDSI
jgi:hypothetical protein